MLTARDYMRLSESERKRSHFSVMRRDASVHVRGEISHPDHATVSLNGWHRVLMNTENRSIAMRFVAFLD